jgi:hypothetical protein
MAVGLSVANLANKWLELLRGVAWTTGVPGNTLYIALHACPPGTDPGSAGTANQAAVTLRQPLVLAAASSGSVVLTGSQPTWAWNVAGQTLTHVSVWTATTGGTFLWSVALSASRQVANGDTFTLTACGMTLSPLAN